MRELIIAANILLLAPVLLTARTKCWPLWECYMPYYIYNGYDNESKNKKSSEFQMRMSKSICLYFLQH